MSEEVVQPGAEPEVGSTPSPAAEPAPIELREDSLVKLPGSDKPVQYGKWFRDFQSKYTEATMSRSQLQRERESLAKQIEEARNESARYRAALDLKPRGEDPRQKLIENLKSLPYVKGEEAVQLYQAIAQELEGGSQKLQKRDQAIRILAEELVQMKQLVGQLAHRTQVGDFETKISRYREKLGLPEEAQEFLAEIYSAYEGDDLDEQFESIAQKRVEQLQAMFTALNKKRVEEARAKRFVPGRGGKATPGQGGLPDTSKMSSKEAADVLFEAMQATEDS